MEWISVKDMLPDDFTYVLTCDCRGNINIMYHHHTFNKPFGIDRHNPRYYMVRYWCPLPKPPKSCERYKEVDYEQIQLGESLL